MCKIFVDDVPVEIQEAFLCCSSDIFLFFVPRAVGPPRLLFGFVGGLRVFPLPPLGLGGCGPRGLLWGSVAQLLSVLGVRCGVLCFPLDRRLFL